MNPKFSIITCTMNSERYISQTLDSIFSQSYDNFELIVIDGFSNDHTLDIVKDYDSKYPNKIRVYRTKPRGISNAMNIGVKKASGELINHLHSDDYYHSDKVLNMVSNLLDNSKDSGWLIGGINIVDDKGDTLLSSFEKFDYKKLLKRNIVPHPSTFIRREIFNKYGGFSEDLKIAMDYDLWLRIGFENTPIQTQEILTSFRVHSAGTSSVDMYKTYKEDYQVRKKYAVGLLNNLLAYFIYIKNISRTKKSFLLFNIRRVVLKSKKVLSVCISRISRYLKKKERPITLLLVRHAWAYGGAEKYNLVLAKALRERGYSCMVGTNVKELIDDCKKEGIKTIKPWFFNNVPFVARSKFLSSIGGLVVFFQYFYFILRYNVQLANIQTREDQILLTFAMKFLHRPVIWTDHGDFRVSSNVKSNFFWFFYEKAIKLTDKFILVCEEEKKILNKTARGNFLPSRKTIVIHNGVNQKDFSVKSTRKLNINKIIIGSTARIQKEKGIEFFIKAMPEIIRQFPNVEFILAGAVDEDYLSKLPEDLGIKDHVKFAGLLGSAKEVANFLEKLDIFIFPSLLEVFPLSIIEAMAMGKIVVATNVGGVKEIVNKNNGFLIEKGSPKEISDAVISILQEPANSQKVQEEAIKTVDKNFNLDIIIDTKIVPLIEKLVKRR